MSGDLSDVLILIEPEIEEIACPLCGNLVRCTCAVAQQHGTGCRYRRAAEFPVDFACDHGFQACPQCDPCNCGNGAPTPAIR